MNHRPNDFANVLHRPIESAPPLRRSIASAVLCVLLSVIAVQAYSVEAGGSVPLEQARTKLATAAERYGAGDIESARQLLREASDLLQRAGASMTSAKAREQAAELSSEIHSLNERLEHDSQGQEGNLSRLWHKASAIIKREAEELIHGYVELSVAERTLKPLLDAKMHLYLAEHDLFVAHDVDKARHELDKASKYLATAEQSAPGPVRAEIDALQTDVQALAAETKEGAWGRDSVIQSLNAASTALTEAAKLASPPVRLQIESIRSDVHAVGTDIARRNQRADYERAMMSLESIINAL